MAKCPWCKEWEGPPGEYAEHLKDCKKYPPNVERLRRITQPQELPKDWGGEIERSDIEADIVIIDRFIQDENSDIEKYNEAAIYMKHPKSKELVAHLAFAEMEHATKLKELKMKLQSELER